MVPTLEGSRPLLVEIQALTTPTSFGLPRRTANGVDFNRLLLVTAVLTKRVGLRLGNQDIMVNVTGGLKVGEPAADLGMALAIASSYRDAEVVPQTAVRLLGRREPPEQIGLAVLGISLGAAVLVALMSTVSFRSRREAYRARDLAGADEISSSGRASTTHRGRLARCRVVWLGALQRSAGL